jgi:TPR repeat protein
MLHDPAGMPSFPDMPEPQDELPSVEPAPSVVEALAENPHEPRAMHEVTGENYLSIARRAANSAAAGGERGRTSLGLLNLPDIGDEEGWIPAWVTSRRSLQIIAAVLVVVVAFIGFRIATRGQAHARPAMAAHVTKTIAMTPDERVVAQAKAGNANAELVVALKLMNGDGVATDLPSAAHWLKKAAVQKQPVAEYWLGTLYERGRGVEKDRAKAVSWYEASAKGGNAKAMYRLGVAYAEGWTGEANYVTAANWFKQSAQLGIIDAQFNLAVLYERGQGVPQSMTKALTWYAVAAAQGDSVSMARVKALTSQLTPAKVAAAKAAAAKIKIGTPVEAANAEPTVSQVAAQR